MTGSWSRCNDLTVGRRIIGRRNCRLSRFSVGSDEPRYARALEEVLVPMARKTLLTAVTTLLLLLAVSPAHAFRCGTRIITRGDHADKILRFCGEPASIQTRISQRSYVSKVGQVYPGVVEEVVIEEWTYNMGPHQLIRVVRLENGLVAEIKHLGYGY
jgi:hypothetical protein